MKSLRSMMMALLLSASVGMPVSSVRCAAANMEENAKGMHFKETISVQYFLELARNRKASRVNNKFAFKSGDEIRFHMKSNIDGYAYIVLRSKKDPPQVLFPTGHMSQDTETAENRVSRDKWLTMPGSGSLQFDNEPGTEKLALIISRDPVDPQSVLSQPTNNGDGTEIARIAMANVGNKGIEPKYADVPIVAMNSSDSKDLVPSRVYIAYNDAPSNTPHLVKAQAKNKPVEVASTKAPVEKSTPEKTAPRMGEKQTSNSFGKGKPFFGKREKQTVIASAHVTPVAAPVQTTADNLPANWKPLTDMGLVTIESTDPSGILAAEISLKHEK